MNQFEIWLADLNPQIRSEVGSAPSCYYSDKFFK